MPATATPSAKKSHSHIETFDASESVQNLIRTHFSHVPYHMAPGSVLVYRFFRPAKHYDSAHAPKTSAIVLPDTKDREYSKLVYGLVIACGAFCDHPGNVRENVQGFPIQPGSLAEIKSHNPWETVVRDEMIVKTEDVTRWWLPGEWPKEWADWCRPK